jgi:carboxyl-terminal processing protease
MTCKRPILSVSRLVVIISFHEFTSPRLALSRIAVTRAPYSAHVVTEGLGPQRCHGRVVILVNEHTSSAGEMVAAFAQENGLASIVGTKTPGRLLSGSAFKAGFGYMVGLPVAAYLTWEGRLIEGKGVSPSVNVELKPEQLLVGEDPQMQRALDVVRGL